MILINSYFILNYISLHSSYYLGYCGMNYANIIGFLSFNIFIIQFLSGILLVSYSNNIFILCYDSVYYIMIEVLFGFIVRWFHCLGSCLFMICYGFEINYSLLIFLLSRYALLFVKFSAILFRSMNYLILSFCLG